MTLPIDLEAEVSTPTQASFLSELIVACGVAIISRRKDWLCSSTLIGHQQDTLVCISGLGSKSILPADYYSFYWVSREFNERRIK